jgi:hypothetical protein
MGMPQGYFYCGPGRKAGARLGIYVGHDASIGGSELPAFLVDQVFAAFHRCLVIHLLKTVMGKTDMILLGLLQAHCSHGLRIV